MIATLNHTDRQTRLHSRFMRFVEQSESGCWTWIGCKQNKGYGSFRFNGRPQPAHRVSHELFIGPAGSLHVLHSCDNPSCVNPGHLFLGTNADNVADRVAKNRSSGGSLPGESSPNAKLNAKDVERMRSMHAAGSTLGEIATEFQIAKSTACRIVNRKRWSHV